MDKIKLALMALGVIFAAVVLYFVVSIVLSLFWYIVIFGVIALAGFGAYKFLKKPADAPQLEPGQRELDETDKLLNQFRRELTGKKD